MLRKVRHLCIWFIILSIFIQCDQKTQVPKKQVLSLNSKYKDSIYRLLKLSRSEKGINTIKYANRALVLSEITQNDSLWYVSLNRLSILNYKYGFYLKFKTNSELYLSKALKNKDTIQIAKANYKMGSYYLKTSTLDSAYYYFNTAKELFKNQQDSLQVTANLLNMAIIQKKAGDYYGSETTSVDALSFVTKQNNKYLLSIYNNLGNTSNELEQYKNALYWYKKSLKLLKKDIHKIVILNNIGNTYSKLEKLDSAMYYLQKSIKNSEISNNTSLKAMVLDNIGYAYFLGKDSRSLPILMKSYNVRQKQDDKRGQIVSQLHLGEFYLSKNKKKAILFFEKSLQNAISLNDVKNRLKALSFLTKIDSQKTYIYDYSFLNDSINKRERILKNQFAKIKYRTKQQETENLILLQKYTNQSHNLEIQKNKKMRLAIISLSLFMILILVHDKNIIY